MTLFAVPAFAVTSVSWESEPNDSQGAPDARSFEYPYSDQFRLLGALNQTSDSDDWYRIIQSSPTYTWTINTFIFRGTEDCTYELLIYDKNMALLADITCSPNDNVYLSDQSLVCGEAYYFNVQLLSGNPTEPYVIEIVVNSGHTT
jgi:hypothetical protein